MSNGETTKDSKQLTAEVEDLRRRLHELADLESERDQVLRDLHASDARYQDLANSISDLFFSVDADLRITYWNQASERITGLPASEVLQKTFVEVFPHTGGSRAEQLLKQVHASQMSQSFVHHLQLGGRQHSVEMTAYPSQTGILVLGRDITDRKRAEDLLRIQRDLGVALSSTIDLKEALARALIATLQAEGIDAGLAYLIEGSSQTLDLVSHIGLSTEFAERAAIVAAGTLQSRLMRSDKTLYMSERELKLTGETDWLEEGLRALAVIPVFHAGQTVSVLALASRHSAEIEVSARHVLESIAAQIGGVIARAQTGVALRISEERFRTVADFTYDWEYWIDPEGRFVYVSPSCERISGYHPGEFRADSSLLEAITHPDDRARVTHHLRTETHRQETLELQFRITTRDGNMRWIGHACQPVYDATGNWAGQRASNRDITDQVLAQESLRASDSLFKSIFNSAALAIFVVDVVQEGLFRYVAVNPTYEQAVGLKASDAEGKNLEQLVPHLSPETVASVRANYQLCVKRGEPLEYEEYLVFGRTQHCWLTRLTPLQDSSGRVCRIIGTSLPIFGTAQPWRPDESENDGNGEGEIGSV